MKTRDVTKLLKHPDILRERLFRWTTVREEGCWVWTGDIDAKGYGSLTVMRQRMLAHRLSWLVHHGDMGSLCVLHRCDNPLCVRPDHLFLGTQADNMRDMAAKGRARPNDGKGERNSRAKLTWDAVLQMRSELASGKLCRAICREYAAAYGVTRTSARNAMMGKSWGDQQ